MQASRKLLCVIDPTADDHPALDRAIWIAENFGGSIELRSCFYDQLFSGYGLFDTPALAKARDGILEAQQLSLNELAKRVAATGIEVTASAVWDRPLYEGIVRGALEVGADLVVKETDTHSVLDIKTTLSNADWSLILTCPVPLWLVDAQTPMSDVKVVAAVDPVHENDKPAVLDSAIIELAEEIADKADGELHAFHAVDTLATVVRTSPEVLEPAYTLDDDVLGRMRQFHRSAFEKLMDKHAIPAGHQHFLEGNVHEVLAALVVKLEARIVVMGAVARSRLKRIFIGSTAERTLGRLHADLVIVKPPGFETPVGPDPD